MKKKLISLLLSGAMCLAMISSCSQNADEPETNTDSSSAETTLDNSTVTAAEPDVTTVTAETNEPVPKTDVTAVEATQAVSSTAAPTAAQTPAATTPKPTVTTSAKPVATTPKPAVTTATAATTPKPAATAESPSVPSNNSSSSYKKAIADISAMDLYKKMTVGWNLGNSLDATGSGLSSETAWGNPKITKELINAVKAAGFDTIRIPVTWMGHFDKTTYAIDEAWLKRVDEVINYALSNDMYVIINIHHDGSDWLTPTPDNEAEMINKFNVIWYQIATYFKDYDEHLLFAGMNEFHKGYSNPSKKYLELTDTLNQSFVTTVRATGGNNSKRILIVQSYNTNGDQSLKMNMPKDTAQNKLMTEIHFYDPWSFAGEGKGDWGKTGKNTDSWGQEDWVDTQFGKIKKNFVDKNIPVILGEYGAVNNKNGNDDHRRYYIEYVTKSAKEHGLLPIWWDNGYDGSSGEAFALFDRHSYKKLHEDIHEAIMKAVSGNNYTIALP